MTPTDPHPHAAEAAEAAVHLRQLRRHAVWLERLAVAVGTAGCLIAALLALPEPSLLLPAAAVALGAIVAWALLRALALVLHVRADEA